MSDRQPIRVALLGYGLAGEAFHAPFIGTLPDYELRTIVTSDPERRQRAVSRWPGATVVDSADDVWASAGQHDLVVVASANRAHHTQAAAALGAGLHVMVDKPLAPTAAEGRDLVERARAAGRLLTVFQNRRWDADLLTLRRLIEGGELGEIWRVESRFERWRPTVAAGAWRESADPADGGGLLLDLGSHLVDQVVQLFGWPTAVHAEVLVRRPGAGVDDDTFLALRHPGDVVSHLWMSATAADLGPRWRVLGSRAAFVVDGLDGQEDQLRAGMLPDDPAYGVVPPRRCGRLVSGEQVEAVASERGAYDACYRQLAAAIRGEGPVPVDPMDSVRVLELLESVRG